MPAVHLCWGKGCFSTCPAPHPQPAGSREGPAVHLLGQSPLVGPAANVAAQDSQRGLVLERGLLHRLDLQRPTLFCVEGQGSPDVGQGPRAWPGYPGGVGSTPEGTEVGA